MDTLRHDLLQALRSLRRRPTFAALAVVTLALGIGATSAIFSVVNGVLLRPLPFERPGDLMLVHTRLDGVPGRELSLPEYWDLRERSRSFSRMAAFSNGTLTLTGSGRPERFNTGYVTADALPLLGVAPAMGRGFAPEEDLPGRPPVVLLSDALWRRRFGADPTIVGRTLTLDDMPTTVIGVMPPGFQLPAHYLGAGMEAWSLLQLDPATDRSERGWHWLTVVARLRPGMDRASAEREVGGIMSAMVREHPNEYDDAFTGSLTPAAEHLVGDIRPVLLVLLGAVALLLLIAASNVASLFLARAEERQREIAVRAALGARAGRLVRQLLTESATLAVAGGAAGLLLAAYGTRALVAAAPPTLPRLEAIGLDLPVLLFTTGVSILTGLVFGLAPAWYAARPDLSRALTDGGRSGSAGVRRQRFRRGLVVTQIALALVLVVAAGLLIRSFERMRGVDPGFDPAGLLTARVELSPVRYESNESIRAFFERLVARAEAIPGVRSAAVVKALPMTQLELGDWSFLREGRYSLPPKQEDWNLSYWQAVGPGYFETMHMPVLQGRGVEPGDRLGGPAVAVVNRTLARQAWPDEDPIGQRLLMGGGATDSVWRTVVGIVGDVRHRGLDAEPRPEIYLPHAQFPAGTGTPLRTMRVVLRADGNPAGLAAPLRAALAELDADIPLTEVQTMEEALGVWAAERRLTMLVVAAFALLALVLGAVGVYGVVAHLVTQRTREIGIRIALGAVPREILRLVLAQGVRLAVVGIAFGLLAALAASRLLSRLLFEVEPTDTPTFVGTAVALALVALAASLLPALRAVRTDPMDALRSE
ncbi:MAG TPA: ABC transporter permease [Gemmatimonadales bacterium]|nr:ABC transporter permease [Gemmatimonadales bacterium]